MKTIRYTKNDLFEVAKALKEGEVIAFPTDTVFGLAVIHGNKIALDNLKKAKGRPETKPIPTMVSSISQLEKIAQLNTTGRLLANAFMPGAITLIMKKQDHVQEFITNGFQTIGIRMPDDDFILSLIKECGQPLLVTSANLSDYPSGLNDEDVLAQLDGRIHGIVVGEAKGKEASTIVNVCEEAYNIVREGPISKEDIEQVVKGERR